MTLKDYAPSPPPRQQLPPSLGYFQLYLFAVFASNTYVFSVIYAFLPAYLLEEGYSTTDLSTAYGALRDGPAQPGIDWFSCF